MGTGYARQRRECRAASVGEVLPAPAGFGGRAAGGGRYLERLGGSGLR
jgi:hypothetical protein